MSQGPTPRDVVFRDGPASLYRFRPAPSGRAGAATVLLVPSLINRWYVLDLRPGASLCAALVARGLDVFCIDWGTPQDEDRYFTWEDLQARLHRMSRATRRISGQADIGILGYCMGATVAGIHVALQPKGVAAFVNLAGPFDFSKCGMLGELVDPRWFDVDAIADAGNVTPVQMQSGFTALRPTLQIAKWVGLADRASDPKAVEAFQALEGWSSDNVAFPAAAYRTYIRELYQENQLVRGVHRVAGQPADLGRITCPVLTVCAARDTICPPDAATALNDCCGATEQSVLQVAGGHVGAVVGSKASRELYPAIAAFFLRHAAAGQKAA